MTSHSWAALPSAAGTGTVLTYAPVTRIVSEVDSGLSRSDGSISATPIIGMLCWPTR